MIVTGIVIARWSPDLKDVRCDLDPVFVANHIRYLDLFCKIKYLFDL